MQLEALGDAGEDQAGLQQGEAVADALAWADAKGDVGIFVAASRPFGSKSVGVELVGVLPKGGMAMERVDANGYDRAGLNVVAANFVVSNSAPANDPGRRE